MKKHAFFCMLGLIMIIASGCGDDDDFQSVAISCCYPFDVIIDEQCNLEVTLGFSDSRNSTYGYYYYLVVLKDGALEYCDNLNELHLQPPFYDTTVTVNISYYDIFIEGEYEFGIMSCTDLTDVCIYDSSSVNNGPLYTYDVEFPYHCGVATCTRAHRYVSYLLSVDDISGSKCKIYTRYGQLCNVEVDSAAQSAVLTDVSCIDTTAYRNRLWCQSGYGFLRLRGQTIYRMFTYLEINGEEYNLYIDYLGWPSHRTTHEYRIELDQYSGLWDFYYDGILYVFDEPIEPSTKWQDSIGRRVDWTGEILNLEDDMAGTENDPCVITQMAYRLSGEETYIETDFSYGNFQEYDPYEWRISFSESPFEDSIFIWDVNPLPE